MNPELREALHNRLFFRNFFDSVSFSGHEPPAPSEHEEVHLEREILLVISGTTDYAYRQKQLELRKGDVLFIDSWEPHQYGYDRRQENCLHLWIHLHTRQVLASVIEIKGNAPMIQPVMNLPDDLLPALNRRWDAALLMRRKNPVQTEHYQSMVRLLQEELLWNVLEPVQTADHESLVQQLENFLSVNYGRRIALAELEKRFGRDRAYLARLFKKTHDMTIGEFIDRNREHYTEAALQRGMTQKEIAAQLGFSSATAFWLWRKRRTGN